MTTQNRGGKGTLDRYHTGRSPLALGLLLMSHRACTLPSDLLIILSSGEHSLTEAHMNGIARVAWLVRNVLRLRYRRRVLERVEAVRDGRL